MLNVAVNLLQMPRPTAKFKPQLPKELPPEVRERIGEAWEQLHRRPRLLADLEKHQLRGASKFEIGKARIIATIIQACKAWKAEKRPSHGWREVRAALRQADTDSTRIALRNEQYLQAKKAADRVETLCMYACFSTNRKIPDKWQRIFAGRITLLVERADRESPADRRFFRVQALATAAEMWRGRFRRLSGYQRGDCVSAGKELIADAEAHARKSVSEN